MFAIIKTGGKQYRVSPGDRLAVERLKPVKGKVVNFKEVLLIEDEKNVTIGRPVIQKAAVVGELKGEVKGKKLYPFHKKRRKDQKRRIGHRQVMSLVLIKEINLESKETEQGTKPKKTAKEVQ